ncbi:MAG: nucleotidyl transferase AbiEii/AbiGii toxin family protein [Planctomycetota bacterium]
MDGGIGVSSSKAESVFAKLKARFRKEGGDFQALLERYALERLLYRLSQSPYADRFVLKGAQLFALWAGTPHRPTRDVDFLGYGDSSAEAMHAIFAELAQLPDMPDDGLIWDAGTLQVAPIRKEAEYGGIRLGWVALLHGAQIRVQVDVGFGDAITPGATMITWPSLLDLPAPTLRAYPPETVIAEKLEAAVKLGRLNSRMKDFYDLHWLAQNRTFDTAVLIRAIRATFERRQTPLPDTCPLALTQAFAEDKDKQTQWQAFLRKNDLAAPPLAQVIQTLHDFLWPLLRQAGGV